MGSKIITSHYLQFITKEKKILKKNHKKKKTNKKLSSNYIKLNIVCKYARKNKSSEKEKENTSKSFCLTSLSLNTISLSKVKKMYQKVILHLSTGRKIPEQKFFICPPMLSKIKNLRMSSLVGDLQDKIKSYKKQIEEAEEIASLNLA